jgi:hypothetical protein
MAAMCATISGRVGRGPLLSVEVPAETYDRYRELKSIWKFDNDQMAELATDGGRLPLSTTAIQDLLEQMEKAAVEMGAHLTAVRKT